MANPVVMNLEKGVWHKVAENVTKGYVHILSSGGYSIKQTYRVFEGDAPTGDDEGVVMGEYGSPISAVSGIDVYLFSEFSEFTIRVDL